MSRNVEIKAKVRNREEIIRLARELTGKEPAVLQQHDVFYSSPEGRLKMRTVEEDKVVRSELIWYDRPDIAGPKESKFYKLDVPEKIFETLSSLLQCSMGIKGEVKKTRTLFMCGRTRIHIDSVEGLGDYMELEVCLSEQESAVDGEKEAKAIKEKLGIIDDDLLEGAYMDMLKGAQS
ncbi:putative adenylyl cyclase CyaB [Teladorsagia circumcincta]|uniref:Putative adenylyl cyclase CyaB n=1 Tax=Teladorsagia circumcincta TaxID=45464 RepID=A0A2G9UMQ5_TELCI|nr:putative adenylyl cyclase CyaB [Teladorsagia circumcincta]